MKIYVTWILLLGCIITDLVHCDDYKNDFEVFEPFPSGSSGKSQSLYPAPSGTFDFLDDEGNRKLSKRYAGYDLSGFKRISPRPEFTQTRLYIAPEDVERRFTRNAQNYRSDYTDGYKAFLDKYFDKSENERPEHYSYEGGNGGDESKSSKYRQQPEDVERIDDGDHGRGYDDDYNSSEYERIKALSRQQEKEIKQNPKHCKIEIRGDMKCSLCKNPETGAHSESCSFSSTPPEKKYAYTKERNYNSKDDDKDNEGAEGEEEEEASNTNESTVTTTKAPPAPSKQQPRRRGPQSQHRATQKSESIRSAPTKATAPPTRRRYSSSYKAEESRPQHRIIGLDPFLYGSHSKDDVRSDKAKRNSNYGASYEDYFSHVFPEARNGKLQRADDVEEDDVEFLPNYDSKKNVEKVLEEFKTKDWSTCTKELKGDLTCYHCKDDNGVRHEECMYVSGSAADPKSSRLSYSETKEYHRPDYSHDHDDHSNASSKIVTKTASLVADADAKNDNKKASRKLVVRKRKAKVQDPPKPEDVEEHQSGEKKSIKRMVSYRIENSNSDFPAESMVFEHQVSDII